MQSYRQRNRQIQRALSEANKGSTPHPLFLTKEGSLRPWVLFTIITISTTLGAIIGRSL